MKHKLCILYALIFSNLFIRFKLVNWIENEPFLESTGSNVRWVKLWDNWYAKIPKILYDL